jgi:hypothetical protein
VALPQAAQQEASVWTGPGSAGGFRNCFGELALDGVFQKLLPESCGEVAAGGDGEAIRAHEWTGLLGDMAFRNCFGECAAGFCELLPESAVGRRLMWGWPAVVFPQRSAGSWAAFVSATGSANSRWTGAFPTLLPRES